MIRAVVAALLLLLMARVTAAAGTVSATSIDVYTTAERAILAPAFVDAVKHYLRRYHPRVEAQNDTHVRMLFVYDYQYAAELRVGDMQYEIEVTLVEDARDRGQARRQAVALVLGVQRNMNKFLQRRPKRR